MLYLGLEIARNPLQGPHRQSRKQFYASHVGGKRAVGVAGELGASFFLEKVRNS